MSPSGARSSALLLLFIVVIIVVEAQAFHLPFGHRLFKSAQNPQLNPASSLIRPIECRNSNNHSEFGICMFSIDCMQNKGVPLSVCKHNYFVGTCCRLPDYNNFVGIVYDLRETEANQALEARRSSAASSPSTPLESPASSPASTSTTAALVAQPTQATASSQQPVTEGSAQQTATTESSAHQTASKLEQRYMISSTSLFPTAQPASSISSPNVESARNVDGQAPASINLQNPLVSRNQIELDSFHIQTAAPVVSSSNSSNSGDTYELIRPAQEPSDPTNTASSQQFSTTSTSTSLATTEEERRPLSQVGEVTEVKLPKVQQVNSVYLMEEQQQPGLVFANNHSQQPTTTASTSTSTLTASTASFRPPATTLAVSTSTTTTTSTMSPSSVASPVTSDQEFTLSTSSAPDQSPNNSSTSADFQSDVRGDTYTTLAFSPPVNPPPSQQPPREPSSGHVDLVSSPAGTETTTPFTSSLSTALLPNVSSHPYAPTEAPPPSSPLVVQTQPPSPLPALHQRTPSPAPSQLGQLYSSQHSQAASNKPSLVATWQPSAAKIVTGGSSMQNLIPGLQSSLLSHIPFKLASGLSSGLSSYLQAHMKPAQSPQTRPLISSNNQPAAQFLLQKPSSTTSATGAVRFPTSSAPASASASVPAASTPSDAPSTLAEPNTTNLLQLAPTGDAVRDAQLVCGRPQVMPLDAATSKNKRVARIVGGNQSMFGQWPWMVSLRQWRKGAFLHKCGAALLNEKWAITAAHCVENVKASDLLLRLGEFDVSNQEEPFPYVERRVKQVVSHPLFDPKTFEYDLALLRFAEPIRYERNVVPVCVPSGNDSYVDRMATVIGWGRLYEDGPLPDVIQHVDVPIITNNECEKMYKNAGYIEEIPDMFICAGISKGGRDSCEGDSGGPLTMVDHDGRSYLVGIISWGIGCALPSQPGVYTRITAFSGWINQITSQ